MLQKQKKPCDVGRRHKNAPSPNWWHDLPSPPASPFPCYAKHKPHRRTHFVGHSIPSRKRSDDRCLPGLLSFQTSVKPFPVEASPPHSIPSSKARQERTNPPLGFRQTAGTRPTIRFGNFPRGRSLIGFPVI